MSLAYSTISASRDAQQDRLEEKLSIVFEFLCYHKFRYKLRYNRLDSVFDSGGTAGSVISGGQHFVEEYFTFFYLVFLGGEC